MLVAQGRIAPASVVPVGAISYIAAVQYERKSKNMFESVRKIARAFRVPSIEDREMSYLNGAVDRIDLEYRQRQIDRGLFRRTF
jgi:hypothetical protein